MSGIRVLAMAIYSGVAVVIAVVASSLGGGSFDHSLLLFLLGAHAYNICKDDQ
jgi:hypothetical protein